MGHAKEPNDAYLNALWLSLSCLYTTCDAMHDGADYITAKNEYVEERALELHDGRSRALRPLPLRSMPNEREPRKKR